MQKIKTKSNFNSKMKLLKSKIKRDWDLYLLLLPGVIWFLIFAYKPMTGLVMAFYNWSVFGGIDKSTFIGLDNFKNFIFNATGGVSADFTRVISNTLIISIYQMVFAFPIPIFLAIMITEMKNKFVSRLTQTVTFLPYFISVVVVCGIVINFTSPSTGIINIILNKFGFDSIYFMMLPQYFRGVYTTMTIWQTAGFNAIVYIAALMGIDPQLYEAATIDGAGKFKKILHITFPSITPTIVTMFILNVGKMVKVGYEAILLLYKPTTYSTADVISTYSYRLGIEQSNYGMSTAVGLFEALIALIMVVLANQLSKKISNSSVW